MIIVNDWNLLTIIIKRSILDVAVALDPPMFMLLYALLISISGFAWSLPCQGFNFVTEGLYCNAVLVQYSDTLSNINDRYFL